MDNQPPSKLEENLQNLLENVQQHLDVFGPRGGIGIYFELLQRIDVQRRNGNVNLRRCPSNNAWEGQCQDVSCIVSNWCMHHAALYDDQQVFFTCCDICKQKSGTTRSVAFLYNRSTNQCFKHQQENARSRGRPLKRRVSQFVLDTEKVQLEAAERAFESYMEKNSVLASALEHFSSMVFSYLAMTPPVSPDSNQLGQYYCPIDTEPGTPMIVEEEMYDDIILNDLDRPDSAAMFLYDDETPLDLDIKEVMLSQPLQQEEYQAALEDVLGPDSDGESTGEELMSCSPDSLTTRITWTLNVLEQMESHNKDASGLTR